MSSTNWEDEHRGDGAEYSVEEESLESLELKLAEYQKSLEDVRTALELSPDEPVSH